MVMSPWAPRFRGGLGRAFSSPQPLLNRVERSENWHIQESHSQNKKDAEQGSLGRTWPGQVSPPALPIPPAPGHRRGSPGCRQGGGGKLTKKPPSPQERRESLWQRQPCRQGMLLPAGQPKLVSLEAATGRPGSPALLRRAVPMPAAGDGAAGRAWLRAGAKGPPSTLRRSGGKV